MCFLKGGLRLQKATVAMQCNAPEIDEVYGKTPKLIEGDAHWVELGGVG